MDYEADYCNSWISLCMPESGLMNNHEQVTQVELVNFVYKECVGCA